MTIEIREGRGVGEHKDHIHLEPAAPSVPRGTEKLPGISESARISPASTHYEPDPGHPGPCTTILARRSDQLPRRGRAQGRQRQRRRRSGPVRDRRGGLRRCARRESASARTLLDLVVFGRAVAQRCAATTAGPAASRICWPGLRRGARQPRPAACYADSSTPTAEIRANIAEDDAGRRRRVPHRQDPAGRLREDGPGVRLVRGREGFDRVRWSEPDSSRRTSCRTCLQRRRDDQLAEQRHESRGAHAREDFPNATTRTG